MAEKLLLIIGSFVLGALLLFFSERKVKKHQDLPPKPPTKEPKQKISTDEADEIYEQGFNDGVRHAIQSKDAL